jgi:hypothetical protein
VEPTLPASRNEAPRSDRVVSRSRRPGKASPIYPSSAGRSWTGSPRGCSEKSKASNSRSEPRRALDATSELCAIFDGLYELAGNPTKPVTADDIVQTRRNIRELTKVGEREIHEVILSCTRARRQLLNSVPTAKPTLH